jgi:hypothetical protein
MPIIHIIICVIIAIKTPLWLQLSAAIAILGLWVYKCAVSKRLLVDIEAPMYLVLIIYFFILIGIGDLLYYFAYYDRVNNTTISDVFFWFFKP